MKQCPAVKVRLIAWQLEQTIDEMPLFVMRLGEFSSILDEKLDFGTFKFCFVVGATLIVSTAQQRDGQLVPDDS